MPAEIRRLTVSQFVTLLQAVASTLTRKIDAVHLHHTWRPTRSQFKGQSTIEAMRNYHVNHNGWSDIAQHLTIDPHGLVWTGRNWNSPPASQVSKNGNKTSGPFMIEMVGDFDLGRDVLDGEQRDAAVAVVAALLGQFGLAAQNVHFHRELGALKSCPGTGVDKEQLLQQIDAALSAAKQALRGTRAARARPLGRSAGAPFGPQHFLGYEVALPVGDPDPGFDSFEINEHQLAADTIREETRARVLMSAGADRDLSTALSRTSRWEVLRPYVINLTKGRLSQSGEFTMPDGSIEAIIDSIRQYAMMTDSPRIMMHAHGGLVGEKVALNYAHESYQWWLEHGVYPLYFIWETHLFEILKQRLGMARGILGDARDRMFEATARAAGGKILWGDMKESARLASSIDAGGGEAGGARIFAEALATLIKAKPGGKDIAVHAVGHSAGAILHAHLLPVLMDQQIPIDGLAYLAPAIRIDLFKQMLLQPIIAQQIKSFAMFTMDEEAERDDDCVAPLGITLYGKSLLYLVSRAFETKRKTPILGLEEMLNHDAEIMERFDPATPNRSRLELAYARGKPQNEATQAKQHGCFDNDAATMASVFKTVTGALPNRPFPLATSECAEGRARALPALSAPISGAGFRAAADIQTMGGKRALCVGIDQYRDSPLGGCVRDANTWASLLSELHFDVTTLLDGAATRQSVLDSLKLLVESARPGDSLVFQYSGHGTQVEDLNGDESDRYDEALVPVDYHTGALLLDDDLAEIYRLLPDQVVLTLFMDCCHSGTNSRFAAIDRNAARSGERRRFLELSREVTDAHRRFRARFGSAPPTSAEESLPGIIHFAACLDNQYAYESDGQGHFTRIATADLKDAIRRGVTNEDFSIALAGKVGALGRPQTPRLMRLPAPLSDRVVLMVAANPTAASTPLPAMSPGANREWDAWCLEFFEAGAAHWRARLGR
jgi:hypothetical protein